MEHAIEKSATTFLNLYLTSSKKHLLKVYQRYSLPKVFWVVLSIYVFFLLLGVTVTAMSTNHDWAETFQARHLLRIATGIILSTLYFFVSLNLYNHIIVERKSTFHYVKITAVALIAVFTYNFGFDYLFPPKVRMNEQLPMGIRIFSYAVISSFIVGLSLMIAYLNNLRDEKIHRKVLEAQKMQLEVEKSQANYNFLKAQINPHFLHNTLNFLYAKSLPYSQELSEGILTLSDIMRYALSEGNAKDGRTLLKDEIEHLQNVVKIHQLRFSNKLNVELEVNGVVNGATIIPFVLITLVENAFKHGDLKSVENPIRIRIDVGDGCLYFFCRNKKKSGPKELSTGIGLENIQKQLELAYGSKYSFKVKDESEFYTTELTISTL